MTPSEPRRRWPFLSDSRTFIATAAGLVVLAIGYGMATSPGRFFYGDSYGYWMACGSLCQDGDLKLENQIRSQVGNDLTSEEFKSRYSRHLALDRDGDLVLIQSPALSIISMPFYRLLGEPGLILCNALQLTLLIVAIARLAGSTPAARVAALLALITTPLWTFAFSYSQDLLPALSLLGALIAARANRPILAGLCVGLCVWAKPYMILLAPLPACWIIYDTWQRSSSITANLRPIVMFVIGGLPALAAVAATNTWLFGAPWITGYDRMANYVDGAFVLKDHYGMFTTPIARGLYEVFGPGGASLLVKAPLWFLWPLGLLLGWRCAATSRDRAWLLLLATGVVLNVGLFVKYDNYRVGDAAIRFIFPSIALAFVLIEPLIRLLPVFAAAPTPCPLTTSPGSNPIHDPPCEPAA